MSEATYQILYREIVGAGNDTEANIPHGIVVTLSRWNPGGETWKVPTQFYLLQSEVMVDREIVVDEIEMTRRVSNDSVMIRNAIARMDELKELNPEVEAVTS